MKTIASAANNFTTACSTFSWLPKWERGPVPRLRRIGSGYPGLPPTRRSQQERAHTGYNRPLGSGTRGGPQRRISAGRRGRAGRGGGGGGREGRGGVFRGGEEQVALSAALGSGQLGSGTGPANARSTAQHRTMGSAALLPLLLALGRSQRRAARPRSGARGARSPCAVAPHRGALLRAFLSAMLRGRYSPCSPGRLGQFLPGWHRVGISEKCGATGRVQFAARVCSCKGVVPFWAGDTLSCERCS